MARRTGETEKERVHCTAFFPGPPEAAFQISIKKVSISRELRRNNDANWTEAGSSRCLLIV